MQIDLFQKNKRIYKFFRKDFFYQFKDVNLIKKFIKVFLYL